VFKGILDRTSADNAGTRYANQPGDTSARGLLADMLAQGLQQLVDAGVVPSQATP